MVGLIALLGALVDDFGAIASGGEPDPSLERIVYKTESVPRRELLGIVLLEAEDGGILAQGRDGALVPIDRPDLLMRDKSGETFVPWTGHEQSRALLEEMGDGWEALQTRRYVVCTQAPREYAEWCATLLERLQFAFDNFWTQRGVKLRQPEFPLIMLIFRDEATFLAYGQRQGHDLRGTVGFYDVQTNRVACFDFSNGAGRGGRGDLQAKLRAAAQQVATVIHEATHQIAFNTGLHTRLADNPVWLTEGMAMYFETPDLNSDKGWKTIGAVSPLRLNQFRAGLPRRPADSLTTLIASDARFTDPEQRTYAYAEAWTLTHFLIKTRGKDYQAYVETISRKPRLEWNTPEERLREFQAAFGADLGKLEKEWLRYASRLKPG